MSNDKVTIEPNSATSGFVTIKVKTNSDQVTEEKNYCVHLDKSKSLKECRPIIEKELKLQVDWNYLSDEALLTKGAEPLQTIAEMLRDNQVITLQRELSNKEKQKVEADAYIKAEHTRQARLAEKETVRREHMALTHKTLTTLQETLNTKNAERIKAEELQVIFKDLSSQVASSIHGGSGDAGKEQLRSKNTEDITSLVKSLGLPRTAGRTPGDGGFQALSFVATVKSDDDSSAHTNIANKYTVALNETENRVESFQEEWEKKACESGFSQMAAEISLAYGKGPISAAVSANYSQGKQTNENSKKASQKIYLVGMQEVKKARITIPPTEIMLNDEVEKKFKEAVKDFDVNNSAEANQPYIDKILFLLDRYGYFVITEYTIGGSLHTSETQEKTDSSSAATKAFQQKFGAAVDVSTFAVSGSVGVSVQSGDSKNNQQRDSKQATNFQLSAKGGNVTDKNNPQKWTASLSIDNWEIISYNRLMPIYEIISDGDTCNKLKAALGFIKHAQVRKALFNYFGKKERSSAERKLPLDITRVGGKGVTMSVDVGWHEINERNKSNESDELYRTLRYFKSAQLSTQDKTFQLRVKVTDKNMKNDKEINHLGPNLHGRKELAKDYISVSKKVIYGVISLFKIDTTMLYIDEGYRIVAIRLTGENIGGIKRYENLVGLEAHIENLKGDIKVISNKVKNDCNVETNSLRPCLSPTIVSEGKCVMGIRLAKFNDDTFGIEVLQR